MLKRELGVFDAVLLGLGSIVGTGIFVSLGLAQSLVDSSVVFAIAIAAVVATLNALNSAQLAANLPVSGGTYEYGYHYLRPWLGFLAGGTFLIAKSASAATAALGFAHAVVYATGFESIPVVAIALLIVMGMGGVVLMGIRRSNRVNLVIVSITLIGLIFFIVAGISQLFTQSADPAADALPILSWPRNWNSFYEAISLMFVAFTGYGRITTLGEEVRKPKVTIPLAIVITLVVSSTLYIGVAIASSSSTGQPLVEVAKTTSPIIFPIVVVAGITAMLGVLLNLILGLSRVALAMGRRRDLPSFLGKISEGSSSPRNAIIAVTLFIAGLVCIADVMTTWRLSAFFVLVYYSITNLSAIRMPDEQRLYPFWVSVAGLLACWTFAFGVPTRVWLFGIAVSAVILILRGVIHAIVLNKPNSLTD